MRHTKILLFGLVIYVLGVLPYCAYAPLGLNFGVGWLSRYQIHVPLAMGFIIVGVLKILKREFKVHKNILTLILAYLLANFTLQNMMNCYDFQRDWVRKLAFREIYKDELKDTATIYLKDETGDDGIMLLKEPYRFYEWIGVVNWMYNDDERRFVFTERMTDGNIDQALKYQSLFNISHWWGGEEKTIVFRLRKSLTPRNVYSMLLKRNYDEYFE